MATKTNANVKLKVLRNRLKYDSDIKSGALYMKTLSNKR